MRNSGRYVLVLAFALLITMGCKTSGGGGKKGGQKQGAKGKDQKKDQAKGDAQKGKDGKGRTQEEIVKSLEDMKGKGQLPPTKTGIDLNQIALNIEQIEKQMIRTGAVPPTGEPRAPTQTPDPIMFAGGHRKQEDSIQ